MLGGEGRGSFDLKNRQTPRSLVPPALFSKWMFSPGWRRSWLLRLLIDKTPWSLIPPAMNTFSVGGGWREILPPTISAAQSRSSAGLTYPAAAEAQPRSTWQPQKDVPMHAPVDGSPTYEMKREFEILTVVMIRVTSPGKRRVLARAFWLRSMGSPACKVAGRVTGISLEASGLERPLWYPVDPPAAEQHTAARPEWRRAAWRRRWASLKSRKTLSGWSAAVTKMGGRIG